MHKEIFRNNVQANKTQKTNFKKHINEQEERYKNDTLKIRQILQIHLLIHFQSTI